VLGAVEMERCSIAPLSLYPAPSNPTSGSYAVTDCFLGLIVVCLQHGSLPSHPGYPCDWQSCDFGAAYRPTRRDIVGVTCQTQHAPIAKGGCSEVATACSGTFILA
jgi:hypothetical protein